MKKEKLQDKIKSAADKINLPDAEKIEQTGKGALLMVGAIGLGLGVIWIGKKFLTSIIDDFQEELCQDKIHLIGSACNYADRLYSAIDGPGTNNQTVFEVLNAIQTKREYNRVAKAYDHLTRGNNLNEDLKDDLSESEFSAAVRIIGSKPA